MNPSQRIIRISRPRFWHYLLGPWVIGLLLGLLATNSAQSIPHIFLWGIWWLLPANIFLYGVNDVFDYDTDVKNPKKQGKELLLPRAWHRGMLVFVGVFCIVSLLLSSSTQALLLSMFAFLFLGGFYSSPPLRFKARPLLDMMSNALYVVPALHGYFLSGAVGVYIPLFIAGVLWCMAMHAFSAIPDIEFDKQAGIATTATFLGKSYTLLLCAILYGSASVITSFTSPAIGFLGLFYALACLIIRALEVSPASLTRIYWLFPWANAVFGALITLRILYEFVV